MCILIIHFCCFSYLVSIMPLFTAIVVNLQTILKRVSVPEKKTMSQARGFSLNSTFPASDEL